MAIDLASKCDVVKAMMADSGTNRLQLEKVGDQHLFAEEMTIDQINIYHGIIVRIGSTFAS